MLYFIVRLHLHVCVEPINWSAIHQRAFNKMDSLDVYLEKRQERRRYLRTPPKRAAALSAPVRVPPQEQHASQVEFLNYFKLFLN